MQHRKSEVAALARVHISHVHPITADSAYRLYSERIDNETLAVICAGLSEEKEMCFYWQVGDDAYLDDATFGDVVKFDDLRYNNELGLYDSRFFSPR